MTNNNKIDESEVERIIIPFAYPMMNDKLMKKVVKLLKDVTLYEKNLRITSKSKNVRIIKRGVAEVTKSVRKNVKGIVLFASDVYPYDIISHLPVFCERKNCVYAFLSSKDLLGYCCNNSKPTSVVMLTDNLEDEKLKEKYLKVLKKTTMLTNNTEKV